MRWTIGKARTRGVIAVPAIRPLEDPFEQAHAAPVPSNFEQALIRIQRASRLTC